FRWAPNEEFLVYNMSDINAKDSGPLRRYLMPDDRVPGSRNRGYIMKYDLRTGLAERLTFGSRGVNACDISPDSKKLLCVSTKPNITERPFILYTLFELDLETMKADTIIKDEPFLKGGYYSPDGKQLLLLASPEAFDGLGKNCGNHPLANDYDVQGFLMNLSTREISPITKEFNPSIDKVLQWNRTDGNIYFLTVDKDCKNVYRYVVKAGKFEKLELCEDVITSFSLPQDAPTKFAYIGAGCQSAGVAYMYDMKKKVSPLLANPMGEILSGYELGEVEEWNFTASDGTVINGLKCLPPNFDPQKKYPLIVYYYGGTTPSTRTMTSPYAPQLFASRDYVVYVIQPSGTIGYGQEFSARHVNAWGDYTANDIIEGTQKFCEAHPFVNSKKIGCLGASYGGFMTQYLQTRTDIFAAAVSHAGISNVTSYWGEGYWGYSYNSIAAAESYPWNNPELFTKHGSLFNADKINTPLLLLHGTKDTNVPIGESIQLFNALKILGKTVEFISVDGEDHYIADYKMRSQWHD
ncbi:MAG: S9 family peptidase, partial [Bacteroidales bacterium]|nr:S9 family peptidase [Bacteroidales bacterium]